MARTDPATSPEWRKWHELLLSMVGTEIDPDQVADHIVGSLKLERAARERAEAEVRRLSQLIEGTVKGANAPEARHG